jgi:hypothetical protein
MEILAALIVIALLGVVVLFVGAPLRGGRAAYAEDRDASRRADLEAARDAKYQEIRDAELDHGTGKLSDEDWRDVDRRLRAEAVDILHELDELGDDPATIAQR